MRRRARSPIPPAPGLNAALFLDVDGTLLDIAPTPDGVVVPEGLIETLRRLHAALGGAVALVSGRRRADLRALFRSAGVVVVGEHGATASIALPELKNGRGERPPAALTAALRRFAARHPDTLLELKGHGAALHVRRAPSLAPAAKRLAESLAHMYRDRVRLLRGKAVFEFVPLGTSKGRAIEALMRHEPFRGRVPYVIGDDVTDEDAFEMANRLGGASLRVGSSDIRMAPSAAQYTISSPLQLRKWLTGAANALSAHEPKRRARNHLGVRASTNG